MRDTSLDFLLDEQTRRDYEEADRAFLREQVTLAREQQAYDEQWPMHCQSCGGAGAFHDSGDFYQPPSDEPCETCQGQGKCPRCGAETFPISDDGDMPETCSACGWTFGTLGRPEW